MLVYYQICASRYSEICIIFLMSEVVWKKSFLKLKIGKKNTFDKTSRV